MAQLTLQNLELRGSHRVKINSNFTELYTRVTAVEEGGGGGGDITADQITDSTPAGRSVLTAADAAAQTGLLNVVTRAAKGLVPAPGGSGTTRFLREDASWGVPPGTGGGGGVDVLKAYGTAEDLAGWDPYDKGPTLALSNSNRTATNGAGTGVMWLISATKQIADEWHVEMELLAGLNANMGLGILSTGSFPDFLGADDLSIGFYADGNVYKNNAVVASVPGPYVVGSKLVMEADRTAGNVKFTLNNGAYTAGIVLPPGPIWIGATLSGPGAAVKLLIPSEHVKTPTAGFDNTWIS